VTRLLPAHVLVGAAVIGLAAANAVRLPAFVAALGALVGFLAVVVTSAGWSRVSALAVVVAVAGCWLGSERLASLDRSVLVRDVGRSGDAVLDVTGPARTGSYEVRAPARVRTFAGRRIDEPVQVELPLGRAPPQGAILDALVVVRAPRPAANGFDEATWLRRQGIHVVLRLDRWRVVGRRGGVGGLADRIRTWLAGGSARGLDGDRRAVVEGVLLGDDSALTPELKAAFRRSGLYHLLAVSGTNVVLLVAGVLAAAWLVAIPRAIAHVLALGAIAAYVLAVGAQPSVVRAAVAGAAVSIAWLLAREAERWHVLLLGALALLAWNPYVIFDAGFELSFAAVVAIFAGAGPFARVLEGYPVPAKIRGAVSLAAVCGVATAPVLWLRFGAVPLLGVVANALVEPAAAPLLGLAFASAAVEPVAPPLATALAWLNGFVAEYVAWCARVISAAPFAQVGGRAAALTVAGLLAVAAYASRRWRSP